MPSWQSHVLRPAEEPGRLIQRCNQCERRDGDSGVRLCRRCQELNQKALEDLSLDRGEERFIASVARAEWQKRTSTVGGGREVLLEAFPRLAEVLEAFLRARRGDKRKEGGATYRWLDKVGPKQTARIVLGVVLDHFPHERKVRNAAGEIAKRLRMELVARRVPKRDRVLPRREALRVGLDLIDQVVELGLVEVTRLGSANHVVPTPEALRSIAGKNAALKRRWPLYAPMVMPPRRWSTGPGGYRFALKGQLRLIHGAKGKPGDLPLVRRALDMIQDTAWRIDPDVLQLVQEIVSDGGGELGIPHFSRPSHRSDDEPFDHQPVDDEPDITPPWEWRFVRKQATARRRVQQTIAVAEDLAEVDLWFPHYLDWRGRVYPVAGAGLWDDEDFGGTFNPQAGDLARALLRFAEGKPLGDHGARWLALHGAGCYGGDLSRASADDRVGWVTSHGPEIEEAARSPRSSHLVRTAEDPLQFFAFAREWSRYAEYEREGRGEAFVSHLPCGQDASCNGMQHFAALWRDEATALKVNLLPSSPSDRPHDFYTDVAENARLRLLRAAQDGNERADRWARVAHELMVRKMVKRPAMTFGYGATLEGFTLQVAEYAKEILNSANFVFWDQAFDAERGDYRFLAEIIWDALEDEAPGAVRGRQWLQDVAEAFASVNRPVSWTVPITGLPVAQAGRKYMEQTSHRINRKGRPSVVHYESTDQVEKAKQVNGIAPNLIHSLDAANLVLTVERAYELGVQGFGVVHDCYHVLAADAPTVARAARESFVRLHEEPILEGLHAQFSVAVGEDLPAPPEKGSLEIRDVLRSEYFLI